MVTPRLHRLGVQESLIMTCTKLSRALRVGNIPEAKAHLASLIQSEATPMAEDEQNLVPMLTTVLELPSNNREVFVLQLMLLAYCEEHIGSLFAHLDLWQSYAQCAMLECRHDPKLFARECQSENPDSEAGVRERANFWVLSTLFRLDFLSEDGARRMAEKLSHTFCTKELQSSFWTVSREVYTSIETIHAASQKKIAELKSPHDRAQTNARNNADFKRRLERLGKNRAIMANALSALELCREQVHHILAETIPPQ